ncbi:hypothetical protein EJ08DRAFT_699237 [Tothia fuscella]|uniref:DUF7918 domain-containing protein n=1 Tax=Tothia fuscella TaxID=1048955 RepID=A0A9P4NN77_9PEZI|nr:hypothetical protein EJ08DRAFT_699237 [Tothia fuscella]
MVHTEAGLVVYINSLDRNVAYEEYFPPGVERDGTANSAIIEVAPGDRFSIIIQTTEDWEWHRTEGLQTRMIADDGSIIQDHYEPEEHYGLGTQVVEGNSGYFRILDDEGEEKWYHAGFKFDKVQEATNGTETVRTAGGNIERLGQIVLKYRLVKESDEAVVEINWEGVKSTSYPRTATKEGIKKRKLCVAPIDLNTPISRPVPIEGCRSIQHENGVWNSITFHYRTNAQIKKQLGENPGPANRPRPYLPPTPIGLVGTWKPFEDTGFYRPYMEANGVTPCERVEKRDNQKTIYPSFDDAAKKTQDLTHAPNGCHALSNTPKETHALLDTANNAQTMSLTPYVQSGIGEKGPKPQKSHSTPNDYFELLLPPTFPPSPQRPPIPLEFMTGPHYFATLEAKRTGEGTLDADQTLVGTETSIEASESATAAPQEPKSDDVASPPQEIGVETVPTSTLKPEKALAPENRSVSRISSRSTGRKRNRPSHPHSDSEEDELPFNYDSMSNPTMQLAWRRKENFYEHQQDFFRQVEKDRLIFNAFQERQKLIRSDREKDEKLIRAGREKDDELAKVKRRKREQETKFKKEDEKLQVRMAMRKLEKKGKIAPGTQIDQSRHFNEDEFALPDSRHFNEDQFALP